MTLFIRRKTLDQAGKELQLLATTLSTSSSRRPANDARVQSVVQTMHEPLSKRGYTEEAIQVLARMLAIKPKDIDICVEIVRRAIEGDILLAEVEGDKAKAELLLSFGVSLSDINLAKYIYIRAVFDATQEANLTGFLFHESGKFACDRLIFLANLALTGKDHQMTLWACESLIHIGKSIEDAYYECMGWFTQGNSYLLQHLSAQMHDSFERGLALVPRAEQQRANNESELKMLRKLANHAYENKNVTF